MTTTDESKAWRDFDLTARCVIAAALVRDELRARRDIAREFRIELLAAAAGPSLSLPSSAVMAIGGEISARFELRSGEMLLTLQLRGFATLKKLAGAEARIL